METNNNTELLSIIEESKSQTIYDKLTDEISKENLPILQDSVEKWLPKLMINLNSHYVTFLIDMEVTYALCISNRGILYSSKLPIGTKFINEIKNFLNPKNWGKQITAFLKIPNNIQKQLSPLVEWLDILVDKKILQEGEHICYSPDGLLHLVPLHYIEFRGAPLIKFFSLSRTHSATLLQYHMEKINYKTDNYVVVKVPKEDEVLNDQIKVNQLGYVANWFEHTKLCGKISEKTELYELMKQDLSDSIVHFSTHGYFPSQNESMNPFNCSGLLLCKDGQWPKDEKFCGLLSPEHILMNNSHYNFNNSHITLQACVSGLSREGVGGDLLGLEWVFLISGAQSVLSTHWNIDVKSSAEFCIEFYKKWLFYPKISCGQALRETILSYINDKETPDNKNPYNWAAFTLAGDWR